MASKNINPCWKCTERKQGCAAGCEKWKNYTKIRNADYEKKRKISQAEFDYCDTIITRILRLKKKNNKVGKI